MKNNSIRYPLTNTVLDNDDIESGIKVLKSKWITMGRETLKFENTFLKKKEVSGSKFTKFSR